MRIITGRAKGLRLKTPNGMKTRPTADRIKESTFNILAGLIDFEGLSVLDLFAGTGALGLEAISRGAASCAFVDLETFSLINYNVTKAHCENESEVIGGEVFKVMKRFKKSRRQFDLIFCDPPYHLGLWQRALIEIDEANLLSNEGLVIIEHGADENMESALTNLESIRQVEYGKTTAIEFFKNKVVNPE